MPHKGLQRLGDWVPNEDARVINRTGAERSKGDLVMIDLGASDGDVDEAGIAGGLGADDHPLSNAVTPATAGIITSHWCFGVVLQDGIADDAEMQVRIVGVVGVNAIAAVDVGENIFAIDGSLVAQDIATAATGALAIGTMTESGGAAVRECVFNGWGAGKAAP